MSPRSDAEREDDRLPPERCVYGRHPVREAIRGRRTVEWIAATEAAWRDLGDDVTAGFERHDADGSKLAELAGSHDHQGVVASVSAFAYADPNALIAQPDALILCLDQVTDPHNLGAIARVADACGAAGVVVPEHRSARVTASACKASAGALEHVDVAICRNVSDFLVDATRGGCWVYGASERGEREYTDVDLTGSCVLVLGAEGAGLRPRVESACDELVRVPMYGTVASLNVATVSAILAFESVRQRSA